MQLDELAQRLGGTLIGDPEVVITGVAGIREARGGELTFLANPRYAGYVETTEASAILLARKGATKGGIKAFVEDTFGYDLDRSLDDIRPDYIFDVSCAGSVPESIISFLEADGYEDAIRNAISLGGDTDTMACIAGGIAQAFWGVPDDIREEAIKRLNDPLKEVVFEFEAKYMGEE